MKDRKITPKQTVEILKKHGTEISEADAEKVMEFMRAFRKLKSTVKVKANNNDWLIK